MLETISRRQRCEGIMLGLSARCGREALNVCPRYCTVPLSCEVPQCGLQF